MGKTREMTGDWAWIRNEQGVLRVGIADGVRFCGCPSGRISLVDHVVL